MKELREIQAELKAPKDLYNSYGGFEYRSAEGILEAVKPLLAEKGLTLILTDDVIEVGGKNYIKATAYIFNDAGEGEAASAFAREPESKKGMDPSQLTGTASSYARKYALNGLFLIDDNKDPDTDNYRLQGQNKAQESNAEGKHISAAKIRTLVTLVERTQNADEQAAIAFIQKVTGKASSSDLTEEDYTKVIKEAQEHGRS